MTPHCPQWDVDEAENRLGSSALLSESPTWTHGFMLSPLWINFFLIIFFLNKHGTELEACNLVVEIMYQRMDVGRKFMGNNLGGVD